MPNYGPITRQYVDPTQFGAIQPPQQQSRPMIRTVYSHKTTRNKSFLDMHHYLKSIGIRNNEFMLALIDPDLENIDPHDTNLNIYYKQKILRECLCNYWYFIREVVRVPDQGGQAVRFKLTRANLAVNFCMSLNFNCFEEVPRQQGKTVSACIRYLYIYNFGTTNSKMGFFHKNAEGSRDNLQTLKDVRDLLPPYLQMKEKPTSDGKIEKGRDSVTMITNPFNNNNIKTFASATNKAKAASLARGKSLTLMWYDEYGFLPFNDVIYMNAAPAFKTASMNAKRNGSPYGILITTTPGFMTTNEGQEAYHMKELATKFDESWYDMTAQQIDALLKANTKSDFVYIKFSYQQLGCSEEWFSEICKLLKNSWPDIRREILLEWNAGVENSPFKPEDLETISALIKQPISTTYLLGKYRFETYLRADIRTFPPIIGVDVSGGYKQDSSCITIIDSQSTNVLGCLNCNYISTLDLARCIEFIVKQWMPNAVVNVERNGGFGSTVIAKLIKMGLKRNLYYEIKDIVVEERQDGVHAYKQKVRTKVYGLNSTKSVRQLLIDILIERVENHKDKVISPIIYNELLGMEIKRNGKVEHSASTHDDQVFSWLMALYVWYEGINLAERFGIRKVSIRTDEEIDEQLDYYNDETVEIVDSFLTKDELEQSIEMDLNAAINAGGTQMKDFLEKRAESEKAYMNTLMMTPLGEKAYRDTYNVPAGQPINTANGGFTNVPDSVFLGFYDMSSDEIYSDYNSLMGQNRTVVPEADAIDLNDSSYRYQDYFNF